MFIKEMNIKNSNNFISKLQNLVNKIQKASDQQIQKHSIVCQKIISQVLKNQKLNKLTTNKFRLLSFEVILFCYENQKKIQINKQSALQNNRLLMYLVSIKNLLASIQQLLNNKKIYNQKGSNNNGNFIYSQVMKRFADGINKINGFLTESQQYSKHKEANKFLKGQTKIQQFEINKFKYQEQNQNDLLLQQMQQILSKKQKRISQLNITIKQNVYQIQNINLLMNQLSQVNLKNNLIIQNLSNQLNQMQQKHKHLQIKIQILKEENRISNKNQLSIKNHNIHYQNYIQAFKQYNKDQDRRYSYNNQNKKDKQQRNSLELNHYQVISVDNFYQSQTIQNKFSDSFNNQSTKNFLKIDRNKQQKHKNQIQQFYRFLLCQASTIQELI